MYQQYHWSKFIANKASANDVLRDLSIIYPPVPIFEIAKNIEIEVIYAISDKLYGALDTRTRPRSFINENLPKQYQRFILALHIGHLINDQLGLVYKQTYIDKTLYNYSAYIFAKNILYPSWMVSVYKKSWDNEYSLSEKFEIPLKCLN